MAERAASGIKFAGKVTQHAGRRRTATLVDCVAARAEARFLAETWLLVVVVRDSQISDYRRIRYAAFARSKSPSPNRVSN